VHFRPFRSPAALTAASFVLLLGLGTSAHAAGAKDKEAQKLLDSAMNDDYLATEFAKAEKKLKDAISKCGSSDCSADMQGKLHIALGTVYAVGLSKNDEAKAALVAALKADPKAALDPSLTTPELTKLYDEAKKSAGSSGSKGPPKGETPKQPAADAQHTPPAEAPVNTPLPIYVEPNDEVPLSKVNLRYKIPGEPQYKSIEMKKMGKGYGAEIPCADVTTTGAFKYFFAFTGADGDAAGGLGSSKEPFQVTMKNEIEGDAPKLPGKKAPDKCKDTTCPPGLAGCEEKDKRPHGIKGWGASCEQPAECKEGLTCLNGSCEEDKGGPRDPKEDDSKKRMNLVTVGVQLDLLNIAGLKPDKVTRGNDDRTGVCSGTNPSYACFEAGTAHQFFGYPVYQDGTNGIQGGLALAGARFLVGYERQLVKSVGFTLGLRLGVAVGGSPTPDNTKVIPNGGDPVTVGRDPNANLGISAANSFLRVHAEGRASYYFGNSMLEKFKFRPYIFIGGGVAQVNASVPVQVCDRGQTSATPSGCPGTSKVTTVDAYQITGLNFVGFGGGTTFGFHPNVGLSVEVKLMFDLPTFGFVLAPTLGPVFAF
jgi:hypothetical protein